MASNFRLDELIRPYPQFEYQSKQLCWDATPTQRVLKCKRKGGTRVESSFVIRSCPKFRRG